MLWNETKITKLLNESDRAVERAIIAIYDRQTQDEKMSSDTKHRNGRGFRANHGSKGSYYARWCLGGRRLSGHHLENARQIALHYVKQLAAIANAKMKGDPKIENTFESQVQAYMKTAPGESRQNAEIIIRMRMAGVDHTENEYLSRGPKPGTYAYTARMLTELGIMTGDEADAWKDMMKDGE